MLAHINKNFTGRCFCTIERFLRARVMHRDEGVVNRRSLPAGNSFETCVPWGPPGTLFPGRRAVWGSLYVVCAPFYFDLFDVDSL